MTLMRKGLTSAGALLAAVVALLRARPRLPGQRWSLKLPSAAIGILALTGSSMLALAAGPSGPVVAALVMIDPVGLRAGAAFGTSVATAGPLMVVGAPMLGGGVAYVYTRGARAWRESAELRAPDTQAGDFFGGAVAVTGTTVVVGADNHDNMGAAYVFAKASSGWHLTAELAEGDGRPGSGFGYSVAIGAGTIVVGAPAPVLGTGTAYVFRKGRYGWRKVAELHPEHAPVGGFFGFSVAASGSEAVVGDPGDMDGAGRAFVFSSTSGGWGQTAELVGGTPWPGTTSVSPWPSEPAKSLSALLGTAPARPTSSAPR